MKKKSEPEIIISYLQFEDFILWLQENAFQYNKDLNVWENEERQYKYSELYDAFITDNYLL